MENSNNNKLYIIIGALSMAVVVLAIAVVVLLFGRKPVNNTNNEKPATTADSTVKEEPKKNKEEKKDFFAKEVEKEPESISSSGKNKGFVLDGFEFDCPSDYKLSYDDSIGVYIYVSDVFQMKLGVRDRSYEEYIKMGDEVTKPTIDVGGTILKDVQPTVLNGRDYLYFMMELYGDKCLVAFTALPVDGKSIGGQVVIENDNLSEEEVLGIFDAVVSTATVTDKPNSTLDDVVERNTFSEPGILKDSTELKHGNSVLSVKVPEGFYSMYENETDRYASESFCTDEYKIMVECLYYPEDIYFEGAKNYVTEELEVFTYSDEDSKNTKVEKTSIDGNDVYYFLLNYKSEEKNAQKLEGAIDLNGGIYTFEASVYDEDVKLSFDTVKDFFKVKVK